MKQKKGIWENYEIQKLTRQEKNDRRNESIKRLEEFEILKNKGMKDKKAGNILN